MIRDTTTSGLKCLLKNDKVHKKVHTRAEKRLSEQVAILEQQGDKRREIGDTAKRERESND